MPIYQITGKNGVVYRVNGPAGLSKEQVVADVLSKYPEAGVPPQEENLLEKIPGVGGLLAGIADIPLGFVGGLAGTAKAATDLFGADNAVSGFLGDVAEGAADWKSSGAREDAMVSAIDTAQAEGKGTWEEIKAAGRGFLRSPLETTASVAGSAVPFIAAALATEGAAVPLMLGAGVGVGTIKGEVRDAVYEEFKSAGATEEQALTAADKAQEYSGKNLDQIALGGVLGSIAGATGFSRQIATSIGKRAAARVAANVARREAAEAAGTEIGRKSVLAGAARGVAEEAIPEAVQGGQERFARNMALIREGADIDPWQGVAGQAASEGIASILLGGYGGARSTRIENTAETTKQYAALVDALPDNPTEEDLAAIPEWALRRGFNEEEASLIAKNAAEAKARIAKVKQETEEELKQRREARTAGVEPSPEPDITAPGMVQVEQGSTAPSVDEEERAAMMRAYEAEASGVPVEEAPASPTPSSFPQQTELTPDRAGIIISDPVALSDYEAAGGNVNELYAIAEGEDIGRSVLYSRGRRPKDVQTEDMFGALPMQEAPGEALKRDEYNAQRFASEGEKAALQEQAAKEAEAGQERVTALQQRETEQRDETLGDIEYALRAQAPENAVYKVLYEPEDANPYKLVAETQLGKKPEEVIRAPTLKDFSDQVYGRMVELTPYTPETPSALQDIEPIAPTEQEAPTVATRMVQDFVKEVDAARAAGQIDNNQRAQLVQRMYRPDAYRQLPNGRQVPNDAIATLEAEALEAASVARNASAEDKATAEAAAKEANTKLRTAVKNSLLNPARAALKSMVEMRQDEKVGAKVRAKEAKAEGDVREARDAKIDLAQQKVQKYRKAPSKGGMLADTVQAVVDKVTAQWKSTNPVTVVQSINDIRDARVLRAIRRDGAYDAEGLVAPDGTVYLIADNLTDTSRAKAVLFHEGLGHIGLEKLFRDQLDGALVAMYRSNAKLRADVDKWQAENKDAYKSDIDPLARAVEEVLAERSENGQLERNFLQKVAAIIRNFARKLGMPISISDSDVAAILSKAHDLVVRGDTESAVLKGLRYVGGVAAKYSRKNANTSKADAKKVEDADVRLSEGARKVEKSFATSGLNAGFEEMASGRSFKDWAGAIWSNWGLFSPAKQAAMLKVMPSSGILGWVKPNFKELHSAMSEIDDRVHKMNALKQRILAASDDLARQIQDFVDEHGVETLASVQAMARINEIAPDQFASMDEALQKNAVVVELEKRLLKNSNNKPAARKLIDEIKAIVVQNKDSVQVKGDKYTMAAPLIVKLRALEKLAVDATKTKDQVEQLSEMTRRIRDTHKAWDALGKQKGGHAVYKEMRSYYKDMFEAELALLDERINTIADKDDAIRMKDMRAKLMREIADPAERKKSGDLFWDIDADMFQKDYFPFMREGQYWLRVTGDKGGTREREFYTFRTEREMRDAQKKIAARLGVDPEKNDGVIATGLDVGELQEHLRTEDALMQRVFDVVGKAREKFDRTKNINLKELTDSIYQTWLMTTPERSVRRRLMHAEEVVGFSPDVFLHFREQATAYANQLSKLAYAGQIRLAVERSRDLLKDPDRPTTEKAKWNAFVSEFETRADQEMNPEAHNAAINLLNRSSYYYYLTSAKTALLQLTSIPIRVVPRLWRDYGVAEGTGMWIKYMKMWNSLGRVKVERGSNRYGDYLDALMPSVNGSQFVKNSADLQWAKKMGMDRGLLETLHDTLVQNERATAGKTVTGARRKLEDTTGNVGKTMSFMFNGMENISRQATYYMTFELALKKYRAENRGASDAEARDYAFGQAMDVLRNTLGDYSSWERPSLMKGNISRALFMFKMHPITQTKFMVGALRDIFTVPGERAGALKELSGVLMMAGMFGGLMGMPLYSAMTYALMAAFGPDEEDDEDVRALMGGDPRTAYNPDIAFRSWMNEQFGDMKVGGTSLADILVAGPISAATNTELASSTSLDIKNMWFRDAVVGDSLEDTITATAIANIAGLSMVSQMLRGYESFKEGKVEDGLKKILPAFFRTWVNAAVNAEQGVKNRRGDTLIPKEDISAADTFRDALGFRAPKLARIQQYYITRAKNETAIKSERTSILDRFEQAWSAGDIKTRGDLDEFMREEAIPFNRTYPDPEFLISEKTLADSIKRRAGIRARTIEGVQYDKKTMSKDLTAQERFVK